METITAARSEHAGGVGGTLKITSLDPRKWKRFLHWITFRRPPVRSRLMRITGVTATTFTVNGLLDSRHWTRGGTFITNFSADRLPVMKEAARRFDDPDIFVFDFSEPPAPRDYGGCLHDTSRRGDLSDFWRVVKTVERDLGL